MMTPRSINVSATALMVAMILGAQVEKRRALRLLPSPSVRSTLAVIRIQPELMMPRRSSASGLK